MSSLPGPARFKRILNENNAPRFLPGLLARSRPLPPGSWKVQ